MKTSVFYRWWIPGVIFLLSIFSFLPTLQNEFINWGDQDHLVENSRYRGLGWSHLVWMFTTFYMGHYQPLSWVTLGLDYLMWGMNPGGYHFTNLVLHGVNAVLFYFVSFRLLNVEYSAMPGSQEMAMRLAAGMAALFFSLHPLRVESVAWATERSDVLSGLFFLWTILCYLQAVVGRGESGARWRWMRLAYVFYSLSLLSKASVMTLPLVLLVLDVCPLRRLGAGAGGWSGAGLASVLREKVPFVMLALGAAVVAAFAQFQTGALATLQEHGLFARIAQSIYGLVFYLGKTVFPVDLSPLYELTMPLEWWNGRYMFAGFVVMVVSVGLFVLTRYWPAGVASWLYYVVMSAPFLGFVQSGPQIAADRYTYLTCLGWATLAGGGLYFLWRGREGGGIGKRSYQMSASLAAAVLVVMGVLSWKQAQLWHDSATLWSYVVSSRPNSALAKNYLGQALSEQGKFDEAIELYRGALQIKPRDKTIRYNLGNALAQQGRLEEAIGEFQQVLQIDGRSAKALYDLGTALAQQGKSAEAIDALQQVIKIDSGFAKAYYNLGAIFAKQGKSEQAIAQFRHAVRLDPAYGKAHYQLAFAQARRGEMGEAIEHYRQAIKLIPGQLEIHFNYAIALVKQDRLREAVGQFQEALRIQPDFAPGYHALGTVLMAQGEVDRAIDNFTMALRIQPEFAEAHQSLGGAFALQGKRAEAMRHYEAAMRIFNTHPDRSAPR